MCGVRKLTRANVRESAYDACSESSPKQKEAEYDDRATWVNPRGVFSSFMFTQGRLAMPYNRRGDWERATLLFRARECRFDSAEKGRED